ncbi:MAG: cytochrome-c oxidase, cbb3-type subunit II, partial [Myxococcales bacterium]|nr:cytochrome-c oxidase, cbb3-type subunit II [Myxococcales bacterium]
DKLRTDPVLKFMVAAITFYGMSTFEGPMMSLKSVNSMSHYTNWTIGHVHSGALGWNGFLTFSMLYWMVPRLYKRELYSVKLATAHFWIGLVGIGMYVMSMWSAGVAEGLMWKEFKADGSLAYSQWTDTLPTLFPMYIVRAVGGTLFFVGLLLMVYNLIKTVQGAKVENTQASAPPMKAAATKGAFHYLLEGKPLAFTVLTTVAVAAGGAFEIIPTIAIKSNVPTIEEVKPYTPLELEGRDIYIAEGCYNCHSQMIRPFRSETVRYGDYSKPGEFVYDRPFQFGSRRIGPDLHRIGVKMPGIGGAAWHYRHMLNPRETSKGSIMPSYPWLFENKLDLSLTQNKIATFRDVFGAPYTQEEVENAVKLAETQAAEIADGLMAQKLDDIRDKKIVALIAYMLRLGTDINQGGQ